MAATTPSFPTQGERAEGTLVSELPVLAGWSWPYVAITGRQDGPQATILAGVHGCEYVSIHAAMRLARELDPAEVRGRILVVPIMNLPAFWERTGFVCPFDGKNPNRFFPGSAGGTFTDAMDYFIFNTCIASSNALLDLHGGDIVEELIPFSVYSTSAAADVVERSRAMAAAFGLPYTIGRAAPPQGFAGMTYGAAAEVGVPGLIAESGGIGQLIASDVDILVAGAGRALQAAGNLPGEPEIPPTTHLQRVTHVYSTVGGFWIAEVALGDEVREGQPIGRIYSLLGEEVESVVAPHDGAIMLRTTSAAVKAKGLLLEVVQ
jgi:predicted deacylase